MPELYISKLEKPAPLYDLPIRKRPQEGANENEYDKLSFNQAFGKARKAGLKTFKWHGKLYGTKLRSEVQNSSSKSSQVTKAPAERANSNTTPETPSVRVWNGDPFQKYGSIPEEYDKPIVKRTDKKVEQKPTVIDTLYSYLKTAINGVKRKLDLRNAQAEESPNMEIPKIDLKVEPIEITGDTLRQSSRRYSLPEIIDLSKVKLGYRNRGDLTPIDTKAGIITSFSNFVPFSTNLQDGTYIGIDSNGNFKAGTKDAFNEGDMMSRTFSNTILDILKDTNGRYKTVTSPKNKHLDTPLVTVVDNDGNVRESRAMNFLVPKGDTTGTTYGNATGGRVILKVGNEIKLVSGSLDTVARVFDEMKKRNNTDRGTFFTLDNGTYARAIRTYDSKLTSEDLRDYDAQNTGGGNFLYIRS